MDQAKVGFISLGCAKNLVDSEVMLGLLKGRGYVITSDPAAADVLVVNTCGFIGPAKEESVDAILEAARHKQQGRCQALVVAGCLAQRYRGELMAELPEVDAFVGTADYPQIATVVASVLEGRRVTAVGDPSEISDWDFERVLATGGHTAYLKIAEGCDCACSFCIIPRLRGRHRSRSIASLTGEARRLAAAGVRELVIVAQDTTCYGVDLAGRPLLAELLRHLAAIDDLQWLRLQYAYPTRITPELIETIADEPKVVRYLDMPMQHGSDRMLRLMNRAGSRDRYLRLIETLRGAVADLTLRTTFIAGHPGETEADFAELLSFIRAIEFDHVGVFAYSQEEDTPAGARADQVPAELRQERRDRAMAVQQPIALRRGRALVGRTVPVLVEARSESHSGVYIGRGPHQAPEIDGQVYFAAASRLQPGDMAAVTITGVQGYDQVGEA